MKWVTRARPKTDRIACPWLIRGFIDAEAEILYVPRDQVLRGRSRTGPAGTRALPDARWHGVVVLEPRARRNGRYRPGAPAGAHRSTGAALVKSGRNRVLVKQVAMRRRSGTIVNHPIVETRPPSTRPARTSLG